MTSLLLLQQYNMVELNTNHLPQIIFHPNLGSTVHVNTCCNARLENNFYSCIALHCNMCPNYLYVLPVAMECKQKRCELGSRLYCYRNIMPQSWLTVSSYMVAKVYSCHNLHINRYNYARNNQSVLSLQYQSISILLSK